MAIRHLRNRVTREVFVRRLAAATDCDVPAPRYRLAPEHPFPAALTTRPLRTALPRRAAAGLARRSACVPAVRVSAAGARRTGRHRALHRSSTSPNRRPPWNRNTTHRSTRSMPC
ncbi:MAG TPA: alpha/beta hydrolase fold domain-containing protein [Aquabacterium sp.]|nr:alpha/beta hydrolase fold domain-containing protein [Aquabacterium sp.]HQC96482.1 alpha/beta hydrolase fold domain-containing protein [Aquabacterium sp.]